MKNLTFIIFALLFLAVFSCSKEQAPVPNSEVKTEEDVADQEGWNSVVVATNNGRLEAKVHYGHMLRYSDKKLAKFDQGVTVDFFDEKGQKTSQLTADRGELNEKNNDVRAMGHVVVVSDTGITLYTEQLSFFQNRQKIVSHEDVMVTTANGDTLYGTGFESDAQLKHWRIIKPHGMAHRGVDLSVEGLKKKDRADTLGVREDTTAIEDTSKLQQKAASRKE